MLQQVQYICFVPVFHYLAVRKSDDSDSCDCYVLASWREAHKCPLLCGIDSQASYHHLPFRNRVLNPEVCVRESVKAQSVDLFHTLDSTWHAGRESMIDHMRVNEFVDGS